MSSYFSSLVILYFYFLTINITLVTSVCEHSYIVKCETLQDIFQVPAETKYFWKELSIYPKKYNDAIPQQKWNSRYFENMYNLERILIIQQLNEIEEFVMPPFKLKYITLYGNNLKRIKSFAFGFPTDLVQLSLQNNSIEYIEDNSFLSKYIGTVDLSDNKLTTLKSGVFFRCKITELIVRHNKLSKIEPNSLPNNLKRLHLDHNNFHYLASTQLTNHNLTQLEQLTISHNKLSHIDDLPVLESLKLFDVSFNNIYHVYNVFDNLKNLKILNLNGNNLIKFRFPSFLTKEAKEPYYFLLAYNRLRNLDLDSVKDFKITVSLRGNPWNCKCIEDIEKKLKANHTLWRTQCDQKLSKSDKIPYCAVGDTYKEECSNDQITEEQFTPFRNLVQDDICDYLDVHLQMRIAKYFGRVDHDVVNKFRLCN